MKRRPPRSTRTDTLCPYTTLVRSGRVRVRGELRGAKPRDRRARFRPRRASFWSSRSSLSSEQLPTRKVEHDFLAAAADRVDANLAIDALDLAASDIGCAAQYLRRFAGHRFEHHGRFHLQHRED